MCDTAVALGPDGVLFAKNSDRDPNEAQQIRWYPAADHPNGSTLRCTWIEIPQVAHTHAVVVSQPWWMWGAEMGTNEFGLTIGNEAVFTKSKAGPPALLGMDLVRLALERAQHAAEAVEVIVGLLERHGQGGPCSHERPGFTYDNSFLIADRDGAMVLETAGRDWAVETVRGPARSISNGLTIAGFAEAHRDPLREYVAAGRSRRARTERAACAASGVLDMVTLLSDHGAGLGPSWSLLNGTLAAPCVHAGGLATASQTTASWIADLRGGVDVWATGTSAPCMSLFLPLPLDGSLPAEAPGSNRYDPEIRWWRHEVIHRAALADLPATLGALRNERDAIQARWIDQRPGMLDALEEADAFDRRVSALVVEAVHGDRRPRWLRHLWRRWNHAAGVAADSPVAVAYR